MAGLLQTAANVATRHRSSSSASTLLPPPTPEHTNYPQSASPTNHHRLSNPQAAHLSSSAPSLGSILLNEGGSTNAADFLSGSDPHSSGALTNNLRIEFEGGTHVIVRPNRIVRGVVILELVERLLATRIRIKFRAEETAMVKVEEGGGDSRGEWIHQMITTFFETEWKLWGNAESPYAQCAWEELEPGFYEFPFALKFPNVNYPPSMEEPAGFGIRYIWTAQADGPALQSGIKSREYITPYRPIILSTPDKEWTMKSTLVRDKKHALAEARAKLYKQSYCPDEPFEMELNITSVNSDAKITALEYKFRKHHEGKMLIQQGTAYQEYIRSVLHNPVSVKNASQISETIRFDVPKRLVSPSFTTRHTRVHYDIQFLVTFEYGHLFKTTHVSEFVIPITIANLPNDHMLRIPDLTSIQGYRNSTECPRFFEPTLEEPPAVPDIPSAWVGPLTAALQSASPPTNEDPPNYFSLAQLPPQFEFRKERKEKTVFLSRPAKGAYHASEISEAVIIPGLFDEDW